MDRELPDAQRQQIIAVMLRHPELKALHELKTRKAGLSIFIQAHIELDPDMKLSRAHAISDAVERDLLGEFPGAEVIIHQDPAGLEQVPALYGASESPPDPRPAP
jgi:ferrous-iron efflux pump FieF